MSLRRYFSLLYYNLSSIYTHQIVLIYRRYNIFFDGFVSLLFFFLLKCVFL